MLNDEKIQWWIEQTVFTVRLNIGRYIRGNMSTQNNVQKNQGTAQYQSIYIHLMLQVLLEKYEDCLEKKVQP